MNGIWTQRLTCIGATLVAFEAGTLVGWSTTVTPKLSVPDSPCFMTSSQIGWIMSIIGVGMMIGPIITWLLADRFGRKLTILCGVVPMIVSYITMAIKANYTSLLIGRLVGGVGAGVTQTILPVYIGEITENKVRGSLAVFVMASSNSGTLFVIIVGPYVTMFWLHIICIILGVVVIIAWSFLPESPYYYLMQGNTEKATKSLCWLRRKFDVTAELNNIRDYVENKKSQSSSIFDVFTSRGNRRAFMIVLLLAIIQPLSGSLSIPAYAYKIFEDANYSLSLDTLVIIMSFCTVVASFFGVFTIDLLGRRPLFFFGIIVMTICLIANGIYYTLKEYEYDVSSFAIFPFLMIIGYTVSLACGPHSVPGVLFSEYFTADVKVKASMIFVILLALGSAISMKMFQILHDSVGLGTMFFIFSSFLIVGSSILFFILPETKGCSLQSIVNMHQGESDESVNSSAENID